MTSTVPAHVGVVGLGLQPAQLFNGLVRVVREAAVAALKEVQSGIDQSDQEGLILHV